MTEPSVEACVHTYVRPCSYPSESRVGIKYNDVGSVGSSVVCTNVRRTQHPSPVRSVRSTDRTSYGRSHDRTVAPRAYYSAFGVYLDPCSVCW